MQRKKIITQIGSLPYESVGEAIEYSLRHDIPFLPELVKLGDSMLEYIKNPGQLSCLEEFRNAVQGYETVKVQCVGPATLIMGGYQEDEAVGRAYEHIYNILDGLKAEEVLLFLDEPVLGQVGFDYKNLWEPLFASFEVVRGVHVCGNMNWDDLFNSDLEIISFDASSYDITTYPHYRSGKRVAWGVENEKDIRDFRQGDLLTLPCGLSPFKYQVEDCEESLEKLIEISLSRG